MRSFIAVPVSFCVCLMLVACGNTWFGEDEGVHLSGERISVLVHEKELKPDSSTENIKIILPRPEPNDEWAQAGGYSHHAMHHMMMDKGLKKAWKVNIGTGSDDRNQLLSEPIAANGLVYAIDADARISAYNIKTGKRLWRVRLTPEFEEDNTIRGGGIAYEDGRLYVTTGFAEILCLNAKNGKVKWRKFVGVPMRAAPVLNGGRVFVLTVENQIHALATSDGRDLWEHNAVSEITSLLGSATPAVDAGVVVAAFSSGELQALRVDSGSQLWSESLSAIRRTDAVSNLMDICASPVIDNGKVYAVGHSGLTVAIDLRTGLRLWEREIGGVRQPWIAGKYLFVATNTSEVIAIEAKTGRFLWITELQQWEDEDDRSGRITWTRPILVMNRLIVAGSHGEVLSISPYTGDIMSREKLSSGVSIPPIVVDKTLLFLTEDADLIAYR